MVSYMRFSKFSNDMWPRKSTSSKEVLVELNSMHSSHIAYAYIANTLSAKSNARIAGSIPPSRGGISQTKLGVLIWKTSNSMVWQIYRALGVQSVVSPKHTVSRKKEARAVIDKLYRPEEPSKEEIESLRVRGILIGDLAYDSYLRSKSLPTVDTASKNFKKFLNRFILNTLFWSDYIKKDTVEAIVVSHTVYAHAIQVRVAVTKGISAFQATATAIYRLNPEEFFAYNEFKMFPQVFRTLDKNTQGAGREMAKERLRLRFEGAVGVDMPYSKASAYTRGNGQRLLSDSDVPKILVATHCFFDSPHAYGMNLFPDFWEWLHFLGKISNRTSYEWYLKTHRDFLPGNIPILNYFTEKYPRFSLLPTDASHHQIIEEGIDVALTVYGTIGFEYPYLGVPVINASVNNPHIAYSFDFNPATIGEYEELLLKIPNLPKPGEKERVEIQEFYFMKHLLKSDDLFFENWEAILERVGGYQAQFTPVIYKEFVKQWTPARHEEILNRLKSFIEAGDYLLAGDMKAGNTSFSKGGA